MPLIAIYLIKLSVSLAVVFLFYQLILQKLTFYNWNRWYLMAYSALAFFIPLINISPVLKANKWNDNAVVKLLPVFDKNIPVKNAESTLYQFTAWDLCFFVLLAGVILMSVRLVLQWVSFLRLKKNANLITVNNMSVYQVNKEIIPFSFGNSVFINSSLHHEQELQEIIRHEFVHVKQKHSFDIIWAEIICVLNWYNPFAWWLKKVIRQNLEFIADSRVLREGIDKKDYQYLLLKVIGNHQFSIANQFNFSSLKKRIAMMNKIKTAKVHLVKFLFLLPLLSVSLLAFRSINTNSHLSNAIAKSSNGKNVVVAGLVLDAATLQPLAGVSIFCDRANETVVTDAHGYYKLYVPFGNEELKFSMSLSKEGYEGLKQNEHWGNFNYQGIYKAYGHTIELFALGKKGGEGYSAIAGNMADESGLSYESVARRLPQIQNAINGIYQPNDTLPVPPPPPLPKMDVKMPENVNKVNVTDNKIDVLLKNGKKESYDLSVPAEKAAFEKKYGTLAPPIPPPPPPLPQKDVKMPDNVKKINVADNKIDVLLKNGKIESYDLSVPAEKAEFEKKYGTIPSPPPPPATEKTEENTKSPDAVTIKENVFTQNNSDKKLTDKLFYLIDGKESTASDLKNLDQENILSVDVLKDETAIAKYGEKAKNGAIIITTKKGNASTALYVINGEVSTKQEADKLNHEKIESVNVLKGESATSKYGDKGKNGVVEIKTKN